MKKFRRNQANKFGKTSSNHVPIEYLDAAYVLDDLGIAHRDSGKNVGLGWIGVCCPFCSDDGFHMGINIRHKTVSCFRCGVSGTILKYLSAELRSFTLALDAVKKLIPRELKRFGEIDRVDNSAKNIKVELPRGAKPGLGPLHMDYLRHKRKNPILDPQKLADEYNLFHTGPISDYPNSIIVPVVRKFRLVTFTTISIADNIDIRYKHLDNESSIIYIKEYLYNIHTVIKVVFVVEGIFDCWRIGSGAVPTFGTKLTDAQILLLSKIPNVVLLFDGDGPGRIAAQVTADKLSALTNVYNINLPDGYDPDMLSQEQVDKIKSIRI